MGPIPQIENHNAFCLEAVLFSHWQSGWIVESTCSYGEFTHLLKPAMSAWANTQSLFENAAVCPTRATIHVFFFFFFQNDFYVKVCKEWGKMEKWKAKSQLRMLATIVLAVHLKLLNHYYHFIELK